MAPFGSPDVIVIGGGIVGGSAAAHLAEAGRSVVLVERDEIAAGASGRNSGVVQHPFDPVLIDLHLETVQLYRELEARDPIGAFHLPTAPAGLLSVSHDEGATRRVAETLADDHLELEPVFLPAGEVHRIEPALAPEVTAVRLEIGYPVAPASATRAYVAWAAASGVDVRVGQAARPWFEGERAVGVILEDGTRLRSADVVVAAGPWSPSLIDPSGRWRPIRRTWGVVVDARVPDQPRHVLEELEIQIEPGDGSGDQDVAFSLVPAPGGSGSLGSTFLAAEPDPVAVLPQLVARGARFLPALPTASASFGAHRVCTRPLSEDGRPLVGRIPWVEALWIVAGHGPWGISTGPATGQLLADLVAGRIAEPPRALDPARFGAPPRL